jgi:hypothetical protein
MLGGLNWLAQLRNNGSDFLSSFNQRRQQRPDQPRRESYLVFWSLNHWHQSFEPTAFSTATQFKIYPILTTILPTSSYLGDIAAKTFAVLRLVLQTTLNDLCFSNLISCLVILSMPQSC